MVYLVVSSAMFIQNYLKEKSIWNFVKTVKIR